jgi:hypothetical protein
MDESTARLIAAALTPIVIYVWLKGSKSLKQRLQGMKPGPLRRILLWPSK